LFWLGSASQRGVGERRPTPCAAPASIEPLEGRRMLAASPPVATAPDPIDLPADLAVGERFTGDVAFLTGVNTARFTAHPSRLPKAVIRWGDGSRARVTTTVGGPDRLVATVPDPEAHAYGTPGTYGVVVTFRRRERVLGRATEYLRVSETPPEPPPPPDGQTGDTPFEYQIKAYEAQDREKMSPAGGVLFIGSSSIRQWTTLARDFPGAAVINRGFGGSEISDSTHYASRIVVPYKPKTIVMYAGENDLDRGSKPSQVLADFKAFVRTVRAALPRTRILFISIKPSPSHAKTVGDQREANRLVEDFTRTDPSRLGFIDVFHPMLGTDGKPRADLFVKDGQHLSAKGYALWTSLVKTFL
jgi:lysophospholipase L1-like esterase